MVSFKINIECFVGTGRNTAINHIRDAISNSHAWLVDYRIFSNKSVNMVIECESRHLGLLHNNLHKLELDFSDNLEELTHAAQNQDQGEGVIFLVVRFAQNAGDIKTIVPAVPG